MACIAILLHTLLGTEATDEVVVDKFRRTAGGLFFHLCGVVGGGGFRCRLVVRMLCVVDAIDEADDDR